VLDYFDGQKEQPNSKSRTDKILETHITAVSSLTLSLLKWYIQGDSGGICNILGSDSMCDSKQKIHMNMGPTLNGYRDNITINNTCIVIRRMNHHVLKM
jgi:hypothetical protein